MESINWHTVLEFLGILGIIGTFYFGLWPRRSKGRPNKLKYIPGEFFNVYKTLLSDDFNLEIRHNGNLITNNIYYISGKLVVRGGDIDPKGDTDTDKNKNINRHKISIILPPKWKWIDTSKEQSDDDINAEFEKISETPDNAILSFKGLRKEDYIYISGIIEGENLSSEDQSEFQHKIKFSHRIEKTDHVKVTDYESPKFWKIVASFFGSFGIYFALLSLVISLSKDIQFSLEMMLFVSILGAAAFTYGLIKGNRNRKLKFEI